MKMARLLKKLGGVKSKILQEKNYLLRRNLFLEYHYSDVIKSPIKITPQYIVMEENVSIFYHARIEGVSLYRGKLYSPKIVLKKGVSIQQNIHLTCANSVVIGENTAIAANVTITDIHHPYVDVNIPIEHQELEIKSVEIGSDCKLYNNSVILPGTKLGKHITVGANSVVSGVFPDYCVIVGAPAKIVKRYDFSVCKWRNTNNKGEFISQYDGDY